MSDEIQNQVNAPVSPAPEPVIPEPEVASKTGNRKMLALFSIVLIFALVLLAAGGFVYFRSIQNNDIPQYTQTVLSPTEAVDLSPTPVTVINSGDDIQNALNEVNSTTDKELQNDLDQANSEGSNL